MTTRTAGTRVRPSLIVGTVLLVCYLGFAAAVVLWPHRVDGDSLGVYRVLYDGYHRGLPRWITYDVVQFAANVLFAAPLGFFVAMILPRRRWWVAVLICTTLFAAGEIAQFFVPSRMPSVLDWLANSLGALVGAVIWRLCSRRPRAEARMY